MYLIKFIIRRRNKETQQPAVTHQLPSIVSPNPQASPLWRAQLTTSAQLRTTHDLDKSRRAMGDTGSIRGKAKGRAGACHNRERELGQRCSLRVPRAYGTPGTVRG
jgi:hypothetical protein